MAETDTLATRLQRAMEYVPGPQWSLAYQAFICQVCNGKGGPAPHDVAHAADCLFAPLGRGALALRSRPRRDRGAGRGRDAGAVALVRQHSDAPGLPRDDPLGAPLHPPVLALGHARRAARVPDRSPHGEARGDGGAGGGPRRPQPRDHRGRPSRTPSSSSAPARTSTRSSLRCAAYRARATRECDRAMQRLTAARRGRRFGRPWRDCVDQRSRACPGAPTGMVDVPFSVTKAEASRGTEGRVDAR
jgi:hypothetical protein